MGIDRDLLIACALCHDVGKPFEFSPSNQARWKANPAASGFPAIRHPAYGVHLALTVGLPEAVAHAAGCHSGEGELVVRGLENTIVHNADRAFWSNLLGRGRPARIGSRVAASRSNQIGLCGEAGSIRDCRSWGGLPLPLEFGRRIRVSWTPALGVALAGDKPQRYISPCRLSAGHVGQVVVGPSMRLRWEL